MKKLITILFAICCIQFANATGVKIYITNLTKQDLVNGSIDDQSWGIIAEGTVPNNPDGVIKIGQGMYVLDIRRTASGVEGTYSLSSKDGKGIINVYFDNPFIGSSAYTVSATGNYKAIIKSINSDASPQEVYVEVTGGDDTPLPTPLPISNAGSNTIFGNITWDDNVVGTPKTLGWQNVFTIKCKVPKSFQPNADPTIGAQTYQNTKGSFYGEQTSGVLSFENDVVAGSVHTLAYKISGIADNVPLVIFDVQVNEKQPWTPPSTKTNPPVDNNPLTKNVPYLFVVGTTVTNTSTIGNFKKIDFNLFGDWTKFPPAAPGSGGNNGGLAEMISNRKKINVLPANVFMNINSSRMRTQNMQLQNVNQNATNQNGGIKSNIKTIKH